MDDYIIVIAAFGGCFILVAVFVMGSKFVRTKNIRSKSLSPQRRYTLAPASAYNLKQCQSGPIIRLPPSKSQSLTAPECLKLYTEDYRKTSESDICTLNLERLTLEDKQKDLLDDAWNLQRNPDEVFVKGSGVNILHKDLLTLRPLQWLNDEIINAYMHLICERSRKNPSLPTVYAFNTFFYPSLARKGYASIKDWTKKVDIFAFDLLLIPIHLLNHWCLVIVDLPKKCATYYDSYLNGDDGCLRNITEYLKDEMKQRKGRDLDISQWKANCRKDIPQQFNGSDCGVFCCKFAEFVTRRAQINFDNNKMVEFRKRMVHEIYNQKLDE